MTSALLPTKDYTLEQLEEVHYHFSRLTDQIERGLEYAHGEYNIEDVWQAIATEKAQFWYGNTSVIVTEIVETPQLRSMHFFLAAGNLDEIEAMYPLIEEYAALRKCVRLTMAGRPGWERSFLTRNEGWKPQHTVFAKELNDGEGSGDSSGGGSSR